MSACTRLPICQPFTLGGTISGLASGNTVTLADGQQGTITQGNGRFTFPFRLYNNTHYSVTLVGQPSGQTCTVSSGVGSIPNANVTDISVQCTTPSDKVDCDPYVCTSENALAAGIVSALNGNVTGYVVIVGSRPPFYGGMARTSVDPPATPMAPDLLMQTGSVSKTLTAVGVLQELQALGLTINDPVLPYIYKNWVSPPAKDISQITFENFLTHTSGFPNNDQNKCLTSVYAQLEAQILAGVTLPATPQYSNCNFAIFRELLPIMEGDTWLNGLAQPDSTRPPYSALLYVSYMNEHVFAPLGVGTNRSGGVLCAPPGSTPLAWILPVPGIEVLSYSSAAGASPGGNTGDLTLSCGGEGWVLSANELFTIINDLANGSVLLSKTQEATMRNNFLGWDNAVGRYCGDQNNQNVCKNGFLAPNFWTYAGILNCSIPVVVFANSPVPDGDPIPLVTTAYNNASVACHAGPTQACQCPPAP